MKRSITNALTAVLAVSMLALSACQQTPTQPAPLPPPSSEFSQGDDLPVEPPPAPAMDLGTLYFDYNRAAIRQDARDVLRGNAEQLRSGGESVRIEGHCDERGDEEYHLALGERRANAVRKYLVNLGVASGQLSTISYGETKPAAKGSGETAWQWNRRAEFSVR